jgi:hypothetical protein
MTIESARLLKPGDKLAHSGVWAYRIGNPETFTILELDDTHIRVSNQRGYVSRYQWVGCGAFVTRDFFSACSKEV